MQGLITLFTFALTIGILVGFHEYGHYAAARMCGVRVLRFAIGFGKPLFRFTSRNKTEWVIGSIPLGGYVKLLDGRDPEQHIDVANEANAFDRKPLWQRSFIVAAGPLANFILAIAFLMVIYLAGAVQLPARLQAPPEASVAAKVGLVAGDLVTGWRDINATSADFEPVISWNQLRWQLLDAITGEKGFVLELTSPSGGRIAVPFPADALPQVQPKQDPLQALGIRPAIAKPEEMVMLRLGPIDALDVCKRAGLADYGGFSQINAGSGYGGNLLKPAGRALKYCRYGRQVGASGVASFFWLFGPHEHQYWPTQFDPNPHARWGSAPV